MLVIVLFILGAVYFFGSSQGEQSTTQTGSYVVQPLPQPSVPAGYVVSIPTSQGNVLVKNFFATAVKTIETAVYVKDNPSYSIIYYSDSSKFTLALYATDASQAQLFRTQAEADFVGALGISQPQACELAVDEEVPNSYDESLANVNYGLSFCSGSVPIPQ